MASVRWLEAIPLYCEVVLSATDKLGNVVDIGQIIPSVWCEDIYYPVERQSAVSSDGLNYYYAVTSPYTQTSVLYTMNTQTKQVTQTNIPYIINNNNGQMLRSLQYAGPNMLVGVYGNIAGFINAQTGQMTKTVTVWPLTLGCNATKYSGSDLDYNQVYIECIGLNKAKPCQYIHTLNVATGQVTRGTCMPANRGIADIVADIGGWNQTWIITVSADVLGPTIALINPTTGQWGQVFDTYQTFVDNKMSFAGAGKSVWNKVSGEFYMDVVMHQYDGIATFDIENGRGHLEHKKIFSQVQTWEGYELIPNNGEKNFF
eukprot:TRINITY_DN6217_c0_g1_i1.p1 TRINITY_DN6217_c0_g1~~TRINITY_DN6217_c0_g1_i1.p1  ORF type:complete len:348 (+),score=87.51 TRINITY_DN6217_c0_g1_i1:98-1045(+)